MYSKIWLSKPHFETDDLDYFKTTMESNWISTVGPNIASFKDLAKYKKEHNLVDTGNVKELNIKEIQSISNNILNQNKKYKNMKMI